MDITNINLFLQRKFIENRDIENAVGGKKDFLCLSMKKSNVLYVKMGYFKLEIKSVKQYFLKRNIKYWFKPVIIGLNYATFVFFLTSFDAKGTD